MCENQPYPVIQKRPRRAFPQVRAGLCLEAGTGIEPVMEDLQSSALPLGDPAGRAQRTHRSAPGHIDHRNNGFNRLRIVPGGNCDERSGTRFRAFR